MNCSDTASTYLQGLQRDKDWTTPNRQALLDYFSAQGIEPLEKILEAQIHFSGLDFTLFQKPLDTFSVRIFAEADLSSAKPIDFLTFDDQRYLRCGTHATAQYLFLIDENGQVCVDGDSEDSAHPIYASFAQMLEVYALKDKLLREGRYEHPPYFELINPALLEEITQDFLPDAQANDAFNRWLYADDLVVQLGQWLHEPSFYLHVYGKDQKQCAEFVQKLQNQAIIA